MPGFIDERIVQMQFDNSNFEKNADKSLKTLDKLEDRLHFKNGVDGLSAVEGALEKVADRFSSLGIIGATVLSNITNKAVNAGEKILRSLTIQGALDGYAEYNQKMDSILSIVSNTRDKGTTMEDVTRTLDELNHYADKTIYSFGDMTRAIGQFTTAGVGLEDSTTAIKGMSNFAASIGARNSDLVGLEYQVSQALSTGTFRLLDWMSFERRGFGNKTMRDALMETAREHNVNVDAMIKKQGSFRDSLKEGWLTAEIFLETMEKFTDPNGKFSYMEDAATQVRTFSKLIDTLGEAVGSGWAKTWELIIGDFDEATKVFTAINNVLSPMIDNMSDFRNGILEIWHNKSLMDLFTDQMTSSERARQNKINGINAESPLGLPVGSISDQMSGYELMLKSFSNAWKALLKIVAPIKEAFRELFPPITAKSLIILTKRFYEFSKTLMPSQKTIEQLKSIFKGFFSLLDIGRMALQALFKAFGRLSPVADSLAGTFLESAASIGDWITGLHDLISANGTFEKIFNSMNPIVGVLTTIVDWVHRLTAAIFGLDNNVGVIGWIVEKLRAAWEWVTKTFSSIKEQLNGAFSDKSFGSDMIKMLTGVAAALYMFRKGWDIKDTISGWKSLFQPIKDILSDFAASFDGIGDAIGSFTNSIRIDSLLKIAAAIGILALSVWLLASIDSEALGGAIASIITLIGSLIGAYMVLSQFSGQKFSAKGLIQFAAGVLILAIAVKVLSNIDENALSRSMGVLIVSLIVLTGAMLVLSRFGKKAKVLKAAGKSIKNIGLGLIFIALALKILSAIDSDALAEGFGVLVTMLIILIGGMILLGRLGKGAARLIAAGAAIMLIGIAVIFIALALKILSTIDSSKLEEGLGTLAGTLFVLFAVLMLFGHVGGSIGRILAAGAAILLIATAMLILTAVLYVLGSMDPQTLTQGFEALVGALLALVVALGVLALIGPAVLAGAAALLLVGVAMVAAGFGMILLATACNMLQEINLGKIGDGLISLGGGMIAAGIGALVMGLGIIGAAALIAIAFACNLLAGLPLGEIAGGLAVLGASFLAIGIGGIILGLGAPGLLLGTVALAALALVLVPLTAAMKMFGEISWNDIGKYFAILATSVLALAGLGAIAQAFAVGFAVLGGAVAAAGAGILMAGQGLKMLVDAILEIPDDAAKKLYDIAKVMAQALRDNQTDVTSALTDVMEACESIMDSYYYKFITDAYNLDTGIENGILSGAYKPINAMARMCAAMERQFTAYFQIHSPSRLFESLASYIPLGAANGVTNSTPEVTGAMEYMGDSMVEAIMPALAILTGLLNGEFNLSPSIRPVVDMTDVNAAATSMSGMFGNPHNISVSTAQDINRRMNSSAATGAIGENQNESMSSAPSFYFTINGSEYQNEEAIAEAVINKIENRFVRLGVARG